MDLSNQHEQAGQTQFVLSSQKWDEFIEALEQPGRHLPRLEKLLRETSVIEHV